MVFTSFTCFFNHCKDALPDVVLLVYPSSSAAIALNVDASDLAIGAVIEQFDLKTIYGNQCRFFSKKFCPAQSKYSIRTYD